MRENAPAIIRVAVIEDDQKFREGLVFLLNATAGLECAGAFANATEALNGTALKGDDIEVVLLDLDLGPGEPDGNASLPRLRERFPAARFLMLTALDQPERIFEAVRRGASGYLRKTGSLNDLPAAIREIQSGYARLSPEVFQIIYDALQNPQPNATEWKMLSPREKEILELLALGYTPKDVTSRLGISYETFKTHSTKIQEKLNVKGSVQAVRKIYPRKQLSLLPRWLIGGGTVE